MPTPSAVPTPYQIFRLEKTAPYSKRRFYELVKLYHPDRHGHCCNIPHIDCLSPAAKMKRYRLVVAANDILSDPARRRAYDHSQAGWSDHPDIRGPAHGSDSRMKTRWSGFHDNGSAAKNATWEDWEKWYRRDEKAAQTPVYFSNGGFVFLVAFVAAASAIGQASRVGEHKDRFAERAELVHKECNSNLQQRKNETRELSDNDQAFLRLARRREQGTNTYLVGTGPRRILIDTGEGKASWSKFLSTELSSHNATVSDTLITHWHPDHIGGVSDLLDLCPDATVHKHSPAKGQLEIGDGQRFTTEGATLRAFYCPGHTTDHMAFVLDEEDAMFTGDNVLGHGTAVFEDLATYMTSLQWMREQFSGRAYPAHGAVIEDGRKRITEYIEHRHQRESQVLHVLKEAKESRDGSDDRSRTPMEMVKIIYEDVPENLHEPAAHGVVLILQKLAKEGKVVQSEDGRRWQIAETSSSTI
ncbi:MAG: hypothetical protein Q9181_000129 [Wetmoreana brouardii]